MIRPTDALVLGGADCVWEDVLKVEALVGEQWPGLVIAVNDVGCVWPRHLDHWVTLHVEKLSVWKMIRERQGFSNGYRLWGRRGRKTYVDHVVRPWGGGSSGLFGVTVAFFLGCEKIVLCGMPMEATAHFGESVEHDRGRRWNGVKGHLSAWTHKDNVDKMRGRVRSISMVNDPETGRRRPSFTRQLLGPPTRAWYREREEEDALVGR